MITNIVKLVNSYQNPSNQYKIHKNINISDFNISFLFLICMDLSYLFKKDHVYIVF